MLGIARASHANSVARLERQLAQCATRTLFAHGAAPGVGGASTAARSAIEDVGTQVDAHRVAGRIAVAAGKLAARSRAHGHGIRRRRAGGTTATTMVGIPAEHDAAASAHGLALSTSLRTKGAHAGIRWSVADEAGGTASVPITELAVELLRNFAFASNHQGPGKSARHGYNQHTNHRARKISNAALAAVPMQH